MSDDMLNLRRFFRNRFDNYSIDRNVLGNPNVDGSPLTLLELCNLLVHDSEPFPRDLDSILDRRFVGWFPRASWPLTYGSVASIVRRQLLHHRTR